MTEDIVRLTTKPKSKNKYSKYESGKLLSPFTNLYFKVLIFSSIKITFIKIITIK